MLKAELAIIDKDIENRSANEIKEVRKQALLSLSEKWYTGRETIRSKCQG